MTRRNTATIAFVVLCVVLVAAAVSLNIGWILVNGRRVLPLVLGILAFVLIIAGIIVYTVFLVREIRRNDQHDAFINAVTHELKTPIASIRLYLETLQAREVTEAQRRDFYRVMLADADRLQQTVEQVLKAGIAGQRAALQHRGAGGHRGARAGGARDGAAAPSSAARDADVLAGDAGGGGADRRRRSPTSCARCCSTCSTTPSSTRASQVQVAVEVAAPAPDTVWVRVRDRGVGIPTPQLKRIFKRFYRFQTRGFKVKGTGLGLFIVRSIVKQHGGRVFAASEGEGKGATFTVELPRLVRT